MAGVALPEKIIDAIAYQTEAARLCLLKLNSVLQAEAKEAYDIRHIGISYYVHLISQRHFWALKNFTQRLL